MSDESQTTLDRVLRSGKYTQMSERERQLAVLFFHAGATCGVCAALFDAHDRGGQVMMIEPGQEDEHTAHLDGLVERAVDEFRSNPTIMAAQLGIEDE